MSNAKTHLKHPEELSAKDDLWKSPAAGHPERNIDLQLRLEAWFDCASAMNDFAPWTLISAIVGLLGDHRVELASLAPSKQLFRGDLPWRSSEYCTRLRTHTRWLADARAWGQLSAVWPNGWSLRADRGGGALRHEVWNLDTEWWPTRQEHMAACVRFQLATRHVGDDDIRRLHELVEVFFQCAAAGDATYGRGDLRIPTEDDDDCWLDPPDLPMLRYHLQLPTRWEDRVPWVHRFNLLGPEHLRRLGPLDELCAPLLRLEHDTRHTAMGLRSLLTLDPIDAYSIRKHLYTGSSLQTTGLALPWTLARFAQAGLLALQKPDWMDAWMKQRLDAKVAPPAPAPPARPRSKKTLAAIRDSVARPPRFLAGCAKATLAAFPEVFRREGISDKVTHWALFPLSDGGPRAMTLFGVRSPETKQLHTMLRGGSLKEDRAAFSFHALRDGWDGEQAGEVRPEPRRLHQFRCPTCDGRVFELDAALEYPDDLDELNPDECTHAADFFTWFWLAARCPACNWEGVVADIECA